MVWMLLALGVVCGLIAVAAIAIRMVWSYDSYLPDYEDVFLCENPGDGS